MKPKEKIVFECKSAGCRAQFSIELEPLAKSSIADLLHEKDIKGCPFCLMDKLEVVINGYPKI